ncbi:MAG: 5-formyltetrahydrofolate cyclo-ligase [Desulfobacterales bacterium]
MEELQKTKQEIRDDIERLQSTWVEKEVAEQTGKIGKRLYEFANFQESNIILLYIDHKCEVSTEAIIRKALDFDKIVVLPVFDAETQGLTLMKINNPKKDLKPGPRNILEPDASRCKKVPIESIEIAIIPGVAFDEKGGRIGSGEGYYDRLIPKLSITTRKVALAYENQMVQQVPIESHDKHVDIIITEKRIIYKI